MKQSIRDEPKRMFSTGFWTKEPERQEVGADEYVQTKVVTSKDMRSQSKEGVVSKVIEGISKEMKVSKETRQMMAKEAELCW
jgi:hypothetical protein